MKKKTKLTSGHWTAEELAILSDLASAGARLEVALTRIDKLDSEIKQYWTESRGALMVAKQIVDEKGRY